MPPIGCRVLAVMGSRRFGSASDAGELSRVEGGPGLISGVALRWPGRVAVRLGGRQGSGGWRCVTSFSWYCILTEVAAGALAL